MHYLWLDFETTGLDPVNDRILEVGCVITDENLDEYARTHHLMPVVDTRWMRNQAVYEMHMRSGLLDDLLEATAHGKVPYDWEVEQELVLFIAPYLTDGKITLAGSGVATFDFPIIKAQMPDLASFLNYWTNDIGTVRRSLQDAGVEVPSSGEAAHRALADVDHHLWEARLFRHAFNQYRWELGNEMAAVS